MPALPSRRELESLKRPELQALCKDHGVKANLKTDALIELLLDTKKTNPRAAPAPPTTRRSVSTRQPSRVVTRISSAIIHDTDDEQDEEEEADQQVDEEETENHPEPEPEPIPPPTRTRKAKDTQTRLGVGRPVVAGGNGARAVTKSVSVAKGKRGRNSKAVKPVVEDTILEEVEEEQQPQAQAGPSNIPVEAVPITPDELAQDVPNADGMTALDVAVAQAMRPLNQQVQTLRSELEQVLPELVQLRKQVAELQALEQRVASLATQVETLTSQSVSTTALDEELKQVKDMVATTRRAGPLPSTPRHLSPAPRPSFNPNAHASSSTSHTIAPIKNHELPTPGLAPSMLGKRSRDSTSSDLTGIIDEGQEEDLSEEELAKKVVRPTKKRVRLQKDPEEEEEVEMEPEAEAAAPRVPSFTVFTGEEEDPYVDPPPPTEGLPAFYDSDSPTDPAPRQTTSTQNASENQHPFTFAFLPISSTPAGASAFDLPSFPYPEAPQSPTPAGPSMPARDFGERTDIFGAFGLPPPGRPRSRITSSSTSRSNSGAGAFVDPAALTRRTSDQEGREDPNGGFGGLLREGDAPALKRTMYGTELEGDTRFGDFGLEGVASFNWGGGRATFATRCTTSTSHPRPNSLAMFASLSLLGLALLPFVVSKTFDVQVGGPNGTLEFSPSALSANVGDQVIFHFNPKNHSVHQSSFADPCGQKEGGFASGFNFVAANSSVESRPTYTVTVNDTEPIWVYCSQLKNQPGSHCGAGMVFAINCPSDDSPNSLGNFKKAALAVGASLSAAALQASATPDAGSGGSPTLTAAYGDVTIPPQPSATVVTADITLGSSTWQTIYTSFVNSPAATPAAAEGAVHTVVVGGTGKLFFTPDHIMAAPRDQVVFQFQQKNHTVTQSSFADPCRPLNALNATAPQGFKSGFKPVGANDTEFPTFTITVNDTAPIWAYCGQTNPTSHCGAGMVFAINAVDNGTRSFTAFQNVAEQLNGTASGSAGAPNQTGAPPNGALSLNIGGGASVVMALLAVAASLL
ncbi:hypothetical protein R3P38DRAFT_3382780 [Favolaschia claudopus]|uniref:SAP domain-containing protein n=1 Tax=Favolaschia claudopus TaxID=2862362 RepID=A0AAW0EFD2_9AGAR